MFKIKNEFELNRNLNNSNPEINFSNNNNNKFNFFSSKLNQFSKGILYKNIFNINNKNLNFKKNSSQKLFSLLDINDKITNSKTTDLPAQYKRYSLQQIKQLYKTSYKNFFNNNNNKNNNNNFNKTFNNINNNSDINNSIMNETYNYKMKKNLSTDLKTNNNNKNNYYFLNNSSPEINNNNNIKKYDCSKLCSRRKRMYKPFWFEGFKPNLFKNKDANFPFGLKCVEFQIKNGIKENNNFIKISNINLKNNINNSINNNKNLTERFVKIKDYLREKMYKSDIFNQKSQSQEKQQKPNKINIFSKDNEIFTTKNIENKINNDLKYTSSRESKSEWKPKNLMPTLLNHSSSKFHILNQSIKNISKTKDEIINECKNKYNNPNYCNKQKSLCEYIDLTRVSSSNINIDYHKALKMNEKTFNVHNNICSEFYDIFGGYKNLCEKPFVNKDKNKNNFIMNVNNNNI